MLRPEVVGEASRTRSERIKAEIRLGVRASTFRDDSRATPAGQDRLPPQSVFRLVTRHPQRPKKAMRIAPDALPPSPMTTYPIHVEPLQTYAGREPRRMRKYNLQQYSGGVAKSMEIQISGPNEFEELH
jgi:hypothetical protein